MFLFSKRSDGIIFSHANAVTMLLLAEVKALLSSFFLLLKDGNC